MDHSEQYPMEVLKVFNNNVLLVQDGNTEKILFSKGIGFGKKTGNIIDRDLDVEKIFIIENNENKKNFNELISYADSGVVGMCEEIIFMIERELGEELDEKIHISLTDHIAFALKRIEDNDTIENPFLVETQTLYKLEFIIARKAKKIIEDTMKINIPEGEIGFIALHIHSARNNGKLSNTLRFTTVVNEVVEFIERNSKITINRESIDFARFTTHVRFAIERLLNGEKIENDLLYTIKRKYSDAYKLAKKASHIIEEELDLKISDDEVGYLAIHIERLKK